METSGRGDSRFFPGRADHSGLFFILFLLLTLIRVEAASARQVPVIILDPGHGGKDAGVVGPAGLPEKEVTLDLAFRVKQRIDRRLGFPVFLTRTSDVFLSLTARASFADSHGGTVFVGIHVGGFPDPELEGFGVYRSEPFNNPVPKRGSSLPLWYGQHRAHLGRSEFLADTMHQEFVKRFGNEHDLGVHPLSLFLLRGIDMPAVVLEPFVLTHPESERRFQSERMREEISEAIFQGIRRFIETEWKGAVHE